MTTPCQNVTKTTALTTRNFDSGRMGASSSWHLWYMMARQYKAHSCGKIRKGYRRLLNGAC